MTSIEHDDDASLAGWDNRLRENVQLPVGFAVLVLTSFGENPVPSVRLAEVLARPVSEVEALAQAPCGSNCTSPAPVEDGFVRVEDGLITYRNPDRAKSAPGAGSRSVTAGSA
jgi:hypothetical protein